MSRGVLVGDDEQHIRLLIEQALEELLDDGVELDTAADGPRGTGLGLPISRQIVEVHGGTLELESEVGAGSTFRFRIPTATG